MRIVYNRISDGGVSVCTPTAECMAWMTGGGGIWDDHPRGFLDVQIERMIAAGHDPDASMRFAMAVQFGGCTTAEAYGVIRDRDCGHLGTAIELWSDALPDRWFRDAWRRSPNGGPIMLHIPRARSVQFKRIVDAMNVENARRQSDFDCMLPPIEINLGKIKAALSAADEENELRSIWPVELKAEQQRPRPDV